MTTETIVDKMVQDMRLFVAKRDHVSFSELCGRYGNDAEGDSSISLAPPSGAAPNQEHDIYIWGNVSENFAAAYMLGVKKGYFHPDFNGNVLTYIFDGTVLDYPLVTPRIVKSYVKGVPLKKDYWIVTLVRPGTHCSNRKNCTGFPSGMTSEEILNSKEITKQHLPENWKS